MIFVTVGTQLHFDRLVRIVDDWAGNHNDEVFIQSGNSSYRPANCQSVAFTSHDDWEGLFQRADRVISHAGMGTIIKSLTYAKPLIVMPRKAELGEHRNDHQRATAERFVGFKNITIVNDAQGLTRALSESARMDRSYSDEPGRNLDTLISELRRFTRGY